MGQQKPAVVAARSDAAWKIKDLWKPIYEEAYELAMAGVNPYVPEKKNPRPMNRMFDSTAPAAAMKLVNRIVQELTPPHEDWIVYSAGPVLEMQLDEKVLEQLKQKLQGIGKIMNMVCNQGEMVASRHAAFMDLVVTGIGVILDLEDPYDDVNPVISQCVSQSEVAIEEDARGRVVGVYRKRRIKVRDIDTLWNDATLTEDLLKMKRGKNSTEAEIEVLEATYQGDLSKRRGKNAPAWHYEVFYSRQGSDPERIVERGYDDNPWTIFRWMTLPGCPYGPGPVLLALADIRTANKIVEMILRNAALALAGMYLVRDDGVLNPDNIMIAPGALITVGSTGGGTNGSSMVPLGVSRDFDIGQLVLDQFQMRIKKWLFDNGLPDVGAGSLSPTEIVNRMRELTQDIGGGIGRISADLVNYVRRKQGILSRRGVIPYSLNIDQFNLKVNINSPLARAQGLQKVEAVIQWLQMLAAAGGQQTMQVVAKLPEIAAWLAEQLGVPVELLYDKNQREENEKKIAQVMAAGAVDQQAT